LEDRIAPGSVWASAAAQAVALNGPFAWIALNETTLSALGPAVEISASPDAATHPLPDSGDSNWLSPFFSRTSSEPESAAAGAEETRTETSTGAGSQDALSGWNGTDDSESTLNNLAVWPVSISPRGDGGGVSFPPAAERFGGVVVAGGLPAKPAPDSAATQHLTRPAAHTGAATKASTAASAVSPTSTGHSPHVPSGHFASQLQPLLNLADSTGGSFHLAGAADQDGRIGALIGGQLSNASVLDGSSMSATTHRPASLLGQAVNGGLDPNLGLRTSPSSSGPFNLVGTHSIGDLVAGPAARAGQAGGFLDGGAAIAAVIPTGRLPFVHSGGDPSGGPVTPAAGPGSGDDSGDDGSGIRTMFLAPSAPPPDEASFTLDVYFRGQDSEGLEHLTETGTISFPHDWDVASTSYPESVAFHADFGEADGDQTAAGDFEWSGNASPTGLLLGYDIDQFNLDTFGLDPSQFDQHEVEGGGDRMSGRTIDGGIIGIRLPSYSLSASGNDSFVASDTSMPTETIGTVATDHHNNFATAGTDDFTLEVGGNFSRSVTWDDTVQSTVAGADAGTDTDTSLPGRLNDAFSHAGSDAHTESDHTEGSVSADGTFTLTYFTVDATDETYFSDSVNGSESQSEPGGGESDSFTESDSGNDHAHLHAEGTLDSWTASLDDDDLAQFGDDDHGSESSSQTTGGETDTNSDSFGAHDGGTFGETFSLSGNGDATGFTATSVHDRIEDAYEFNDHDGGESGDHTSADNETDDYTATDEGDSDEVLTVDGGAESLNAGYTDTVHDGYTDSDSITDGWSSSFGGVGDTGHDSGGDGDGGTEVMHFSAGASLDGWQDDDPDGPSPTWQVTSVDGSIDGTAGVHANDQGGDIESKNQDSANERFGDNMQGTDVFSVRLHGSGTSATLSQTSTYALVGGSEDDTTDRWDDPTQSGGIDDGSEEVDITETDAPVVSVAQTSTIDANGSVTQGPVHVAVADTAHDHEIDAGSDTANLGASPDGIDRETESLNDVADLGEGIHMTADTSGGATTVSVDQSVDGTVGLQGTDDFTDTLNLYDEWTDDAGGNLGGTVVGGLHQGGTIAGDNLTPLGSSGNFGLNVGGSCDHVTTEVVNITPGSGGTLPALPFPYAPSEMTVIPGNIPQDNGGGHVPYDDPAKNLYPIYYFPPEVVSVTVTHSTTVPQFALNETDADANNQWSLGSIGLNEDYIDTTSMTGHYDSFVEEVYPASGDETGSLKKEVKTTETGDAQDVTGEQTTITTLNLNLDGHFLPVGDIIGGDFHQDVHHTETDKVTGDGGNQGIFSAVLTENHDDTGTSDFQYTMNWNHPGAMYGTQSCAVQSTRDYHTTKLLDPANVDENGIPVAVLTGASGIDTLTTDLGFNTTRVGGNSVYLENHLRGAVTYVADGQGGVEQDFFFPAGCSWLEICSGDPHGPYSNDNPGTPPGPVDNRDWFAKAADFAAGMGDAVSCGVTQRIRQGLGYDDVVDHNSGYYKGGQIAGTVVAVAGAGANPCGAARGIGLMMRGVSAVQGAGQLANAADAAKNGDPLGFALNMVGARMSFSKLGSACFAAGTPIRTPDGTKPIEALQAGDLILTRAEADPEGPVVVRPVNGTIANESRLLRLHVAGRVIRTTAEHPFFVRGRGWSAAQTLGPGDELLTESGSWVRCEAAVLTAETAPVFNVEIAEHHTYFVGNDEWGFALWAHNECLPYNQLRKLTKGSSQQAHHLVEKRFAGLFGQKQGQMLSVPLSPQQHQVFTNAWRTEIPYGPLGTGLATRDSVRAAARRIYEAFPEYLAALGL
jgi:hypothetical protein